jgi:hypothetical protein
MMILPFVILQEWAPFHCCLFHPFVFLECLLPSRDRSRKTNEIEVA